MDQYVILAGGGHVGRRTAEILGGYDYEIAGIERDANRCERLADDRLGTIVHGDATDPDVLERAEPERADVFATLTGDEDTNLNLCTTVEERVDGVRTVARTDRESESGDLADSVVSPEAAGAKAAADEILGRNIRSLRAATGNLDVIEVEVDQGGTGRRQTARRGVVPERQSGRLRCRRDGHRRAGNGTPAGTALYRRRRTERRRRRSALGMVIESAGRLSKVDEAGHG